MTTHPLDLDDIARGASLSETRKELLRVAPDKYFDPSDTRDDPVGLGRFVRAAIAQTQAGRLFVVEGFSDALIRERTSPAVDAIMGGKLKTPYDATFILVNLGDDLTYLLAGIDTGSAVAADRLRLAIVRPYWNASGGFGWTSVIDGDNGDTLTAGPVGQAMIVTALSLIADARVEVQHVTANAKLAAARDKRGQPPIIPFYRVCAPRSTVLAPSVAEASSGATGTHRSPIPHDRRGHPRHLSGERVVWVRSSKVNAMIPFLTRSRSFYRVRP